jgi:Polyketide cyclase / dehydrase and lipid transport
VEVDVQTSITIARPRGEVAAFAADPDHATDWYKNIKDIQWKTEPPLQRGSQIEFRARFLGRTLVYTYEVGEYLPGERLVMSTADGPFPMETMYSWSDADGGTTMVLTNRGRPAGFAKLAAPAMERSMRRANLADLRRLKEILEQAAR